MRRTVTPYYVGVRFSTIIFFGFVLLMQQCKLVPCYFRLSYDATAEENSPYQQVGEEESRRVSSRIKTQHWRDHSRRATKRYNRWWHAVQSIDKEYMIHFITFWTKF